jgi:hypothetical protein
MSSTSAKLQQNKQHNRPQSTADLMGLVLSHVDHSKGSTLHQAVTTSA